jgi:hypothetical protein
MNPRRVREISGLLQRRLARINGKRKVVIELSEAVDHYGAIDEGAEVRLQMWRWRKLGTERYQSELKSARTELHISDQEMEEFFTAIGARIVQYHRP